MYLCSVFAFSRQAVFFRKRGGGVPTKIGPDNPKQDTLARKKPKGIWETGWHLKVFFLLTDLSRSEMPLRWTVSMLVVEAWRELRLEPIPRSVRPRKKSDGAYENASTSRLLRRLGKHQIAQREGIFVWKSLGGAGDRS